LLLSLEALVRINLTSFCLKDRVHIQDMLDVGLFDPTWRATLPPQLASRPKQVIELPGCIVR